MICPKCHSETPDGSSFCCRCGRQLIRSPRTRRAHSNGEGYVFQRKGYRTWTARVSDMGRTSVDPVTGKVLRKYVQKGGFQTEREARAWAMAYYTDRTVKPPAPALAHYWELFSSGEMDQLSYSKRTAYKIAWAKCAPIAAMAVDRITVADLRRTVSEAAPTYYPARDMKVLLNHLFCLAAADRYADKDLPSFIQLPRLEEKEREHFTREEQAALWRAFDFGDPDAAWPLLMIYTGMMPGETMKVEIPMISLEEMTITGAGLKTSVRKAATIHFPAILVPVLEALIGGRTEGKLFRRNRDNLYSDYHKLTARLGIRDLDPYACRHTAATALAVDHNVAPETLRKAMRWSKNSNMIPRYVHPDESDVVAALSAIQRPE